MSLIIHNATLVTPGDQPRRLRGAELDSLRVLPNRDVMIENGRISRIVDSAAAASSERPPVNRIIDARGRVLMPAFVDCHTHACWAGNRLEEWHQKLRGVAYLDILRSGGGIMSTVRAVRTATEEQLVELLLARLDEFLRNGTLTVEIKSGYGLSTVDELKMLRSIAAASRRWPGTIVPTALLGHAIDATASSTSGDNAEEFVRRTINETLPEVSREFPGIAVDAFCEQGAWNLEQCIRLFEKAKELGNPIRVHTNQFNDLGMIPRAIRLGARSVDHLEAADETDLRHIASSDTFAVGLPCTALHLSAARTGSTTIRSADLSALARWGACIAIATNCNPGSSPTTSMPLAIAGAVRLCGLEPSHAIGAATLNPAQLLGLDDRGFIAPGARADLILIRHTDPSMLAYEMGGNPVEAVICNGDLVRGG